MSKMEECKASMRAGGSGFANTSLGVKNLPELNFPEPAEKFFKSLVPLKPGIWTSHTEVLDTTKPCWPYQFLPQWIQVYSGKCVIIVLNEEVALRVGDISTFSKSCEAMELAKMPTFWLLPGDALWIPPGHTALTLGIPEAIKMDKEKGIDLKSCKPNQHHFLCLGVYVVMDKGWASTYPLAVRAAIGAAWLTPKEHLPDSWMRTSEVAEWAQTFFPQKSEAVQVKAGGMDGSAGAEAAPDAGNHT